MTTGNASAETKTNDHRTAVCGSHTVGGACAIFSVFSDFFGSSHLVSQSHDPDSISPHLLLNLWKKN